MWSNAELSPDLNCASAVPERTLIFKANFPRLCWHRPAVQISRLAAHRKITTSPDNTMAVSIVL